MDIYLLSPNFDASRSRSNSLLHDPYYCFSASAPCHRRDAVHISSRRLPLNPISTAYEAPRFPASGHAVLSPTTACSTPHSNGDTEARLARIETAIALLTLGHDSRRQEASRDAVQPLNYGVSANAVPFPVPIPRQTSLLMPAATVDSAVANAPGQRLAQPPRLQRRLLPIHRRRLRVLKGTLTTTTCCLSLQIALSSRKRLEFVFVLFGKRRKLPRHVLAPARLLGPLHHLVAHCEQSRESTSFSFC